MKRKKQDLRKQRNGEQLSDKKEEARDRRDNRQMRQETEETEQEK